MTLSSKRITEIADECADLIGDDAHERVCEDTLYLESTAARLITKAISTALNESPIPWVPVTERVPNSRFDILVLLDDGFWYMGHYNPVAHRWEDVDSMPYRAKATHWAEVLLPAGVQAR